MKTVPLTKSAGPAPAAPEDPNPFPLSPFPGADNNPPTDPTAPAAPATPAAPAPTPIPAP